VCLASISLQFEGTLVDPWFVSLRPRIQGLVGVLSPDNQIYEVVVLHVTAMLYNRSAVLDDVYYFSLTDCFFALGRTTVFRVSESCPELFECDYGESIRTRP